MSVMYSFFLFIHLYQSQLLQELSGEGTRWLQSTDLAIVKHFCHLAGQPRRHSSENVDLSIGPVKINLLNFDFGLKADYYGI